MGLWGVTWNTKGKGLICDRRTALYLPDYEKTKHELESDWVFLKKVVADPTTVGVGN